MLKFIPIILPYTNFSIIWDFIHLVFILINNVKIPLEISFGLQTEGSTLDKISQIIFFLNFLMSFNTAYYDNGVIEKRRQKVIQNYLYNRFFLDVIAYILLCYVPFEVQMFKILFIIIKFLAFYSIIEKFTDSFQLSCKYNFLISSFTLLIEIIFLCHSFACMWHGIAQYEINRRFNNTWLHKNEIVDKEITTRYIYSIYFAAITIGTVGYGDITPNNDLERVFITCSTIFSSGVFAYILSNIQNVFREYREKQEDYRLQLIDLNTYMMNREVNPQLQQMARKYLQYINIQGYNNNKIPSDSLNNLSQVLRKEITQQIFHKSLQKIPFFSKNFSSKLLNVLADKMKEVNYGPDEIILKSEIQQIPKIYIIVKGQIQIYVDNALTYNPVFNKCKQFEILSQNQTFNLYEFVSHCYTSQTSARSIGVSTLHYIQLDDFLDVMNQFPEDKEIYINIKDKLNLYKNYININVFCASCKSDSHLIRECPLFFYKPNRLKVVTKYTKDLMKEREQFRRDPKRTKCKSLIEMFDLNQDFQEHRDYYDNLFEINQQLMKNSQNEIPFFEDMREKKQSTQMSINQTSCSGNSDEDIQSLTEVQKEIFESKNNQCDKRRRRSALMQRMSLAKRESIILKDIFDLSQDHQKSMKRASDRFQNKNGSTAIFEQFMMQIIEQREKQMFKGGKVNQIYDEDMDNFDAMRSYKVYMIHNNAERTIQSYNVAQIKNKAKLKQFQPQFQPSLKKSLKQMSTMKKVMV